MSGGSSYSSPSPSTTSHTNCDIVEVVPLNSVQPNVVSQLRVDDILEVALVGASLVAMRPGAGSQQGQIAGSLTPRSLADLLDCIGRGREYVAVVRQLRGGFCEVEIRPR